MFKCPQCQSENIRFMTSLIISAPIKYYHNLVAEAYRDKETIIWGVNWDHDMMLSCAECGKVLRDRHTFWEKMDELSNEVKELRDSLSSLVNPKVFPGYLDINIERNLLGYETKERYNCTYCASYWEDDSPEKHKEDCPILKAQKLLGENNDNY